VPPSDVWSGLLAELRTREVLLLFLHQQRYLHPLVPHDFQILHEAGVLSEVVREFVLNQLLPLELPPGMYFPTPMLRMGSNSPLAVEQALSFHYAFLDVDSQQRWSLRGRPVLGKVRGLFEENLRFEPETGLYFVEYWTENRWDRCYLRTELTPVRAVRIDWKHRSLELNTTESVPLELARIRMDAQERCFTASARWPDILLADTPRFQVLSLLEEESGDLVWEGERFRLHRISMLSP
jgi:hypothetical protein